MSANKSLTNSEIDTRVLAEINQRQWSGAICDTNTAIAYATGLSCHDVAAAINRLEQSGEIKVLTVARYGITKRVISTRHRHFFINSRT